MNSPSTNLIYDAQLLHILSIQICCLSVAVLLLFTCLCTKWLIIFQLANAEKRAKRFIAFGKKGGKKHHTVNKKFINLIKS